MFVFSFTRSLLSLSDDFPESTGVKRIVQALNANVWSSVEMKDGAILPIQLPIALFPDYLIYLCVCMLCDSWCLCLIGHNQGFGLMSSLVASRHNNPRNCPQDPPVSGNFVVTIHLLWFVILFTFVIVFQCVLLIPHKSPLNNNPFSFKCDLKYVSFWGGILTHAPSLWQSSSLPVEGPRVSEEASHTESSGNTNTQGDAVVGKWMPLDEICFCKRLTWFFPQYLMLILLLYFFQYVHPKQTHYYWLELIWHYMLGY